MSSKQLFFPSPLEASFQKRKTEPYQTAGTDKTLRVRDRALFALNTVAATASMAQDVNQVLEQALDQVLQVVDIEAGAISVLDESTRELVFRVQQGWRVHDFAEQRICIPIDQGLSGLAFSTGQPVVTGDVENDDRVAVQEFRDEPVQAMVLAPMRARGRPVGVLGVMSYTPRDFTSDEVTFISAIADQIGIALDNARLFDQARQRVDELTALQEVSTQVASTYDLWTILEKITSSTLTLIDASVVEVYLYEAKRDKLAFATALSRNGNRVSVGGRLPSDGPLACVARCGEPWISNDLANSQPNVQAWREHGIEALAVFPLKRGMRVLGVLAVAVDEVHTRRPGRVFSNHEKRIMRLLAEQAAIAVERTRMFADETRRSTQLTLINQVARQAMATLNLNEILDMAAKSVRRGFGYFNVALLLVDKAANQVVLRAIAGGHSLVMQRGYRQEIGRGLVGQTAQHGKTILVNDVSQQPDYAPFMPAVKAVGSQLTVPIMRGDEVIGVLDTRNLERGAFGEEDVEAMETLADQLAIAIDNARLYEETQRRMAELTALQETNLRIVSALDMAQVLKTVARNVLELAGADDVRIFLHDPSTGDLTFGTSFWQQKPASVDLEKRPTRFTRGLLESQRSSVINHAREHPYFASADSDGSSSIAAIAGFPLMGSSGVVGVMEVIHFQPHVFDADELRVLGLMASQAAAAMMNARLYEETHRRLEELTMLHEVSLAAASTLSPQEIADRVMAVVQQSLGFEHVSLFLLDESLDSLVSAGSEAEGPGQDVEICLGDGLVGWVAQCGIPLRIGDVTQDARYIERIPGVRSALVIPLAVGERVIGVVDIASSHRDAFSVDDQRLIMTVARQVAVAIENARLYQETEHRLAEVSTLYQLARQASTSLDLQERLDSIVWSLKQAMTCRACSIALVNPLTDVLEIRAAAGVEGKWQDGFRLPLGEGVAGRVAQDCTPCYVPDTLAVEDFIFFDRSVRSLLTVPLRVQDQVIGTLTVDSDRCDAFTKADERLLTIAAAQVATAIENAKLYASLGKRAQHLAEAYAELKKIDQLRDEMVQNVSHELRTPLTFVKGYVELLLAGDAGPLTDLQREYLAVVIDKTNAVTCLVSDIMFLQQVDRLADDLSPVSLGRLAQRALHGCAAAATKAGLTLVSDIPQDLPPVVGNEGRLAQVFDNLLGNAIKFSPDGGEIILRVEEVDAMLQVSIADHGIGIPEDRLDQVFERFYQVDGSARRRFPGLGLGLPIAKCVVESHGGEIWVESKEGQGSTFYFSIPKYQAEHGSCPKNQA